MNSAASSTALPLAVQDEWRSERHCSYNNKFFSSLCAATARRYDPETGKERQNDQGAEIRMRDPPDCLCGWASNPNLLLAMLYFDSELLAPVGMRWPDS